MLELQDFQPAHFATLARWFGSQAEVIQWGGPMLRFPLTAAQFENMLAETAFDPPSRLAWMICESGRAIGHAQLVLDRKRGTARLARVAVAPTDRGRGLALPMLSLVLDQAFAIDRIATATLRVYTFNTPAVRTYERLGFRFDEGPRTSMRVDGTYWESRGMSLLRRDWQEGGQPHPAA